MYGYLCMPDTDVGSELMEACARLTDANLVQDESTRCQSGKCSPHRSPNPASQLHNNEGCCGSNSHTEHAAGRCIQCRWSGRVATGSVGHVIVLFTTEFVLRVSGALSSLPDTGYNSLLEVIPMPMLDFKGKQHVNALRRSPTACCLGVSAAIPQPRRSEPGQLLR